MHHIMAFLTFDYSKATITALRMAFSSIFWTNKSKSETIMIFPILGESWKFCLGLPRGWLGPPWGWLGPLMRLSGTFRGLAWASQTSWGLLQAGWGLSEPASEWPHSMEKKWQLVYFSFFTIIHGMYRFFHWKISRMISICQKNARNTKQK